MSAIDAVIGILLALGVGAACRWLRIPPPAPTSIVGALLVLTLTLSYVVAGTWTGGS